ncbi:DUF523 and DUF1722 domain-containing protein [bacterium]|nr:DUF523 and DUF1722 domain-containing protein [candidate division CSSED10-310 bacterium]
MEDKVRLGISSCLMGHEVRYDGQHKLDRFLVNTLGAYVDYIPVCPEVEAGFGVPREAFRLTGDPAAPRLVTQKTRVDCTQQMLDWAKGKLDELAEMQLDGFLFKAKSPSSGMERVKVYNDKGVAVRNGVGIWARAFMERFPLLPVEEEGRLHDAELRENFIERVFVFMRWREMRSGDHTVSGLMDFHTRHKLLLMAHSPRHLRLLGRLVAGTESASLQKVTEEYLAVLTEALLLKATVKKNINTLQHVMGYFKKVLSADEKQELLETMAHYRDHHVPLLVPVTLLNHYVRKYGQPYLARQYYLKPHPIELRLRNHV